MFLLYRTTMASKDMILLVETGQRSRLVTAKVDHFPWFSTTICVSVSIQYPPLGPLSVITQICQIDFHCLGPLLCLWHCKDSRGTVCWASHLKCISRLMIFNTSHVPNVSWPQKKDDWSVIRITQYICKLYLNYVHILKKMSTNTNQYPKCHW